MGLRDRLGCAAHLGGGVTAYLISGDPAVLTNYGCGFPFLSADAAHTARVCQTFIITFDSGIPQQTTTQGTHARCLALHRRQG